MPIKVILADDHRLVLDALADLLASEDDIEMVCRCGNGYEAVAAAMRHPEAVLVLDMKMPGLDGWDVLRELKGRRAGPILILSGAVDENDILRAARLGAKGAFLKDMDPQLAPHLIRTLHAGGTGFSDTLTQILQQSPAKETGANPLTARELEILRCVALGLRNKDIAGRLGIGEGTVRLHLHRIYRKLGTKSRVTLAIYAQDLGLT
jgi:DNA-binding NarL/FixJ family response regulator